MRFAVNKFRSTSMLQVYVVVELLSEIPRPEASSNDWPLHFAPLTSEKKFFFVWSYVATEPRLKLKYSTKCLTCIKKKITVYVLRMDKPSNTDLALKPKNYFLILFSFKTSSNLILGRQKPFDRILVGTNSVNFLNYIGIQLSLNVNKILQTIIIIAKYRFYYYIIIINTSPEFTSGSSLLLSHSFSINICH